MIVRVKGWSDEIRDGVAVGVTVGVTAGVAVGVGLGTALAVGVRVGLGGLRVAVGPGGGGGAWKVKLARARLPCARHVALTEIVTTWPASPRTVNWPERLPDRSMLAEPLTPVPETATLEAGEHQPAPLSVPETLGGSPEAGCRTSDGLWAYPVLIGPNTGETSRLISIRSQRALAPIPPRG
jgi:hypothetical protein